MLIRTILKVDVQTDSMTTRLVKETENYCAQTRLLQKSLQDTKQIFQDINSANFGVSVSQRLTTSIFYCNSDSDEDGEAGKISSPDTGQAPASDPASWQQSSCEASGQPVIAEMTATEEEEIQKVACQPPAYVIFGQTTVAKTTVVNELFGREVLPAAASKGARWKTVFFKYGSKNRIEPVHSDYVVVDRERESKRRKTWRIVPASDLEMARSEDESSAVEVLFKHDLLEAGARVTVACTWEEGISLEHLYDAVTQNVIPVFIYAVSENTLTDKELEQLQFIKSKQPNISIFFIRVAEEGLVGTTQAVNSAGIKLQSNFQNIPEIQPNPSSPSGDGTIERGIRLSEQLASLGFLCAMPNNFEDQTTGSDLDTDSDSYCVDSELLENFDSFWSFATFARSILQRHLVSAVSLMNVVHVRCVDMMITTAYSMARDVLCTPTRLKFAREKEDELYKSLMDMTVKKQDEIKRLIAETITSCHDALVEKAAEYQFKDVTVPESGEITSIKDLKLCTAQIQDLVLLNLNKAIAGRLVGSVDVLRESYTGVLTRCLASLEQMDDGAEQPTKTSLALRDILNAAYHVEIPLGASASFMKTLIEKMKQLMHVVLWRPPPCVNGEWKRKIAMNMLATVSDARCQRLAKSICTQIRDRLRGSHNRFEMLLKQLELRTGARLQKTESQRLQVRRDYAPRVARLSLESRSLKDFILYGKPKMGLEIGRGQYGVVFSCESWGNYGPCAIKSVVPPDDKHWNDLATEFHYTKHVPEHERIVALRGSVIDYTYNNGAGASVLLIMDRLKWDLYAAIERKLPWLGRLVVAIDVVEGIRFLHSQGLVHRDVKLKNVLLDDQNRGKLTDLGFCKPEAMMSGSIVGTPIHMAPELFSGRYDHSVDVYAFGILFWYICAGSVRLPSHFNRCSSKEMLWMNVKGGLRPEKPYQCDPECWELMQRCWDQEPAKRPLMGDVETLLRGIHRRFETADVGSMQNKNKNSSSNLMTIKTIENMSDDSDFEGVDT